MNIQELLLLSIASILVGLSIPILKSNIPIVQIWGYVAFVSGIMVLLVFSSKWIYEKIQDIQQNTKTRHSTKYQKMNKEKVKSVLDELMQLDIITEGEALRMYQDYTQRGKN